MKKLKERGICCWKKRGEGVNRRGGKKYRKRGNIERIRLGKRKNYDESK